MDSSDKLQTINLLKNYTTLPNGLLNISVECDKFSDKVVDSIIEINYRGSFKLVSGTVTNNKIIFEESVKYILNYNSCRLYKDLSIVDDFLTVYLLKEDATTYSIQTDEDYSEYSFFLAEIIVGNNDD
jgi:hypothetical protein